MAAPVTLDELKDFLDIEQGNAQYDNELPAYLLAAADTVEARVGPMATRQMTEVVEAGASGTVVLGTCPVVSVESVRFQHDPTAYSPDTSWSNLAIGEVHLGGCGRAQVTYTVGRQPVPEDLRMATLIVAGHLWDTQRGVAAPGGALSGMNNEDFGMGAQTSFLRARGFALPRRAMELMAPHVTARLP